MPTLSTTRLRRSVAHRAEQLLGALRLVDPRPARPQPPAAPAPAPTPVVPEAVPFSAARPYRAAPAPAPTSPPDARAPAEQPQASEGAAPSGPALELDAVQEIFDEMIRPALQSDGGDIELLGVEGGDVRVRLVGACSSCPSSVLTMKMGIERLLEEELPGFQRLIQVNAPDLSAFEA